MIAKPMQTILTEGIHYGVSAEIYHADPAPGPSLSNSKIKALLKKSPMHAWIDHPRLNPDFQPTDASAKFDLGTVAHALLLEGIDKAAPIDAPDWRTKAAKEARDAARAAGRIPMLVDQFAEVTEMVLAAQDYIARSQLAGIWGDSEREATTIWSEAPGVWCRSRLDLLAADCSVILDYKSTAMDGPADFMARGMVSHGYDTQSVFYPRGFEALGLAPRPPRFLFLVQETYAPYACYLVEPSETMRELANFKISRALDMWTDGITSGAWPGYSAEVHQAEPPIWALREEGLA